MTLTQDDIQSLAWGSAAVGTKPNEKNNYDEKYIHMIVEMSFVKHKVLDYELDSAVSPQNIFDVDREVNSTYFPETKNERIWGLREVTHKRLPIITDNTCKDMVSITLDGKIVVHAHQRTE